MGIRGGKYGLVKNTCLNQYSIYVHVYVGYNTFTVPVWTSPDWSQSGA